MPLIIDGHNLIGQLPTISLDDPDDEAKLVQLLQRYAMRHRASITVFFDRGSYGQTALGGGGVSVVFARSPEDADRRMLRHVGRLGEPARWTLVTSDAALARAAQSQGLRVIPSTDFAARLLDLDRRPPPDTARAEAHAHLRGSELDEWLDLFGVDAEEAARPIDLRRSRKRSQQRAPQAQPGEQRGQDQSQRPTDRQGRPLIKPLPPTSPEEIDEWLRLFGAEDEE